jgi:hypothetical protein
VVAGDGGCEAYTTMLRGCVLSPERQNIAEAETVDDVEGNMCGTVMRGADAPPGSETTSRSKGSRRNLGCLASGRAERESRAGLRRKGEEP